MSRKVLEKRLTSWRKRQASWFSGNRETRRENRKWNVLGGGATIDSVKSKPIAKKSAFDLSESVSSSSWSGWGFCEYTYYPRSERLWKRPWRSPREVSRKVWQATDVHQWRVSHTLRLWKRLRQVGWQSGSCFCHASAMRTACLSNPASWCCSSSPSGWLRQRPALWQTGTGAIVGEDTPLSLFSVWTDST